MSGKARRAFLARPATFTRRRFTKRTWCSAGRRPVGVDRHRSPTSWRRCVRPLVCLGGCVRDAKGPSVSSQCLSADGEPGGAWHRVDAGVELRSPRMAVFHLPDEGAYHFRVFAFNAYGVGRVSEPSRPVRKAERDGKGKRGCHVVQVPSCR
ncbi:uncharacterized protein myom2a isoform X1 [Syngnathus typhle]|uniref:uncharacterized protein myom2a isoform X1 n=1 Tax=Syngnathus typhle TaxID=161592 RepID=UPI002A6AE951|nr:uncharacterized protein myom2a isoform X1 [Syngnathus typhle]